MFYIKKQEKPPQDFVDALTGITTYDELSSNSTKREEVKRILLREQGGLCPLCERKTNDTIEHFLPKSIFPHLQLDYHNLYVCCQKCNEPKADHLVPAYIFDPRFSPFYGNRSNRLIRYSFQADSTCDIVIEKLNAQKKHFSEAYILYHTIELHQLNRYKHQEISGSPKLEASSLRHQRGEVYKRIKEIAEKLPPNQKLEKYDALRRRYDDQIEEGYPEYVSLIVQILSPRS